jgi:hypothetical protein
MALAKVSGMVAVSPWSAACTSAVTTAPVSETPTAEDLVRLDRNRKGKKLSNADWQSSTDPDARIARLKDGRTHLAYKPEHAMDVDATLAAIRVSISR